MQGILSFRGTMDRKRFAWGYLGTLALMIACSLAVMSALKLLGLVLKATQPAAPAVLNYVMLATCACMMCAGLLVTFAACAKRLRSAGLPVVWPLGLLVLMPFVENIVLSDLEPLRAFYLFWDKPFSGAISFVLHLLMFLWPPRGATNIVDIFGPAEAPA